jgi:putative toxin-antitoxin system antitoxin component (TIGR02293 family)
MPAAEKFRPPTSDEILTSATEVFGSAHRAKDWLDSPALSFGWRTPNDMMTTPSGLEAVGTLLKRIEFGVYC